MNEKISKIIESKMELVPDRMITFNKTGLVCSFCENLAGYTSTIDVISDGREAKIKIHCCQKHFNQFSKNHPVRINDLKESKYFSYTFKHSELFRTSSILTPIVPPVNPHRKTQKQREKEEKSYLEIRKNKLEFEKLLRELDSL